MDLVICDSGIRDTCSGICDSGTCDSGICDSGICDSGTCDSGTCDSGMWWRMLQVVLQI